jgi:hypothetical protein
VLHLFTWAQETCPCRWYLKDLVETAIDNSTYHTIKNATTPAVVTDPNTGTIYAVYFRNENGGGNIYLEKSSDNGKTFSQPVRINDKLRPLI